MEKNDVFSWLKVAAFQLGAAKELFVRDNFLVNLVVLKPIRQKIRSRDFDHRYPIGWSKVLLKNEFSFY